MKFLNNIIKNKKYMNFIFDKLITETKKYYINLGNKRTEVHSNIINSFINVVKNYIKSGLLNEDYDDVLRFYYLVSGNSLSLKDLEEGKLFNISFDYLYDDMLNEIPDTTYWFSEICDTRHEVIEVVKEMGNVYKNYIFKNNLNTLEYEIDQIYFISPMEDLLDHLSKQIDEWTRYFLEKESALKIEDYYLKALYNPRCKLGKKKHDKLYNDSFL